LESAEVEEVVGALERQYDAFMEAEAKNNLLVPRDQPLPSAEQLGAEFERFLAEYRD
jgi:hypothetical protein